MNEQTEDKVRDHLQIILSIAQNNIEDILHRRECRCCVTGCFMLGDLKKIAEQVEKLDKELFGGGIN